MSYDLFEQDDLGLKIESIRDAALHTTGDNVIPKELTYNQALNIYIRSEELKKEGLRLQTRRE